MVDVSWAGCRLLVVFGQGHRPIAAGFQAFHAPVIDLDGLDLRCGRVEGKQAIAVDRESAVLLVYPAVVEKDSLTVRVVDELVPADGAPLAYFVGMVADLFGGVLEL